MNSIFPTVIGGDLLKLFHLSSGFRMVEGVKPLQVGDVCKAEARIASVTNTDADKVVKTKGHVYREKPVIEEVSSFLYHGRFHSRSLRNLTTLLRFLTMLLWVRCNQRSSSNGTTSRDLS